MIIQIYQSKFVRQLKERAGLKKGCHGRGPVISSKEGFIQKESIRNKYKIDKKLRINSINIYDLFIIILVNESGN